VRGLRSQRIPLGENFHRGFDACRRHWRHGALKVDDASTRCATVWTDGPVRS
jgi:hypothetical protein